MASDNEKAFGLPTKHLSEKIEALRMHASDKISIFNFFFLPSHQIDNSSEKHWIVHMPFDRKCFYQII